MITYILRRILVFIPMLFAISLISFIIIQLPEGTFIDQKIAELEAQGATGSAILQKQQLERRYGLDQPMPVQYFKWVSGIVLHGDFGESFIYDEPVTDIIWSYIGFTLLLSGTSFIFVYLLAIPLGTLAAMKKFKREDVAISIVSFIGMSLPEFLVALALLVFGIFVMNTSFLGLFSPEYEFAPWSIHKVLDLLKHLWVPAAIVAINGTAGIMRIMRGSVIDTLSQPYIRMARAKGLSRRKIVGKHALRMAINPIVSIMGMSLPSLLSGSAIISIVLNLPTAGLLLFESLQVQDMYLAGSLILMMSAMLLVGNLLADIALALLDPRIRYD
ncbi:ABC transporter permease [bacterium]|nr:ABC transporter permease [bacterium]